VTAFVVTQRSFAWIKVRFRSEALWTPEIIGLKTPHQVYAEMAEFINRITTNDAQKRNAGSAAV